MAYEITNSQLIIDDCFDGKEEWDYKTACCYRAVVTGLLDHPTEIGRLTATVEWTETYPFNEVAETSGVWVSSSCFNCLLPPGVDHSVYWICFGDHVLVLDSGDVEADDRFLIVGLDAKYHDGGSNGGLWGIGSDDDTIPACAFFNAGFAIDTSKYISPYYTEQENNEVIICSPINVNNYGLPKGTDSEAAPGAEVGEFITAIGTDDIVYPIRSYQIPNFDVWHYWHQLVEASANSAMTAISVVNGRLFGGAPTISTEITGVSLSESMTCEFVFRPYTVCPRTGAFNLTAIGYTEEETGYMNVGRSLSIGSTYRSYTDWPPSNRQTIPYAHEYRDGPGLPAYADDPQDWSFSGTPVYNSYGVMISLEVVAVNNFGNGTINCTSNLSRTESFSRASSSQPVVRYFSGVYTEIWEQDESESFNKTVSLMDVSDVNTSMVLTFADSLTESGQIDRDIYVTNAGNYFAEVWGDVGTSNIENGTQTRTMSAVYSINSHWIGTRSFEQTYLMDMTSQTGTLGSTVSITETQTNVKTEFAILASISNAKSFIIFTWSTPVTTWVEHEYVGDPYPSVVISCKLELVFPGKSTTLLESWTYTPTTGWDLTDCHHPEGGGSGEEDFHIANYGDAIEYVFSDQNAQWGTGSWINLAGWTNYSVTDSPENTTTYHKIQSVPMQKFGNATATDSGIDYEFRLDVGNKLVPPEDPGDAEALFEAGDWHFGLPGGRFRPDIGPALDPQPVSIVAAPDGRQVKITYWYETEWKERYFSDFEEFTIAEVEER